MNNIIKSGFLVGILAAIVLILVGVVSLFMDVINIRMIFGICLIVAGTGVVVISFGSLEDSRRNKW